MFQDEQNGRLKEVIKSAILSGTTQTRPKTTHSTQCAAKEAHICVFNLGSSFPPCRKGLELIRNLSQEQRLVVTFPTEDKKQILVVFCPV